MAAAVVLPIIQPKSSIFASVLTVSMAAPMGRANFVATFSQPDDRNGPTVFTRSTSGRTVF